MDLSLSKRDITNTVFSSLNGSVEYRTAKKTKHAPSTQIYKDTEQIGIVRLSSWSKPDTVDVRGHTINLHKTSGWSRSEAFTASNGHSYKWKVSGITSLMLYSLENDHSKDMVAHYNHGSYGIFSRKRPPRLFIGSQGLHIADEIVTTLVYMLRRLRQRQRSATIAAASPGFIAFEDLPP
ncbi:hypothetical protein VKT23_018737 [Stygiomarasmius scandens]|uniref:DUF6593 domain-containing protein n=1 Tax=Marasmiellus scandens TaxID=2682957 RepID=A0ABR1IR69_9AGAR